MNLYIQLGTAYLLSLSNPSPYDHRAVSNPYGIAIVGIESPQDRKWAVDLQLRHQSSMPRRDLGDNEIVFSVKWRPFAP